MLNDAETAIDADLTEDAQQTSQRKHSTGNTCPICEKVCMSAFVYEDLVHIYRLTRLFRREEV